MNREEALKVFDAHGYYRAADKPHGAAATKPIGNCNHLYACIFPLISRPEPAIAIHFRWRHVDTGDCSLFTMESDFYVITPLTAADLAELIDQIEHKMLAISRRITEPITTETENTTS